MPRRVGLSLFRLHIENGAAVAVAMTVAIVGGAILAGRPTASLAATGALCASILDQPGPTSVKLRLFAIGIVAATAVIVLTALSATSPWLLAPLIAAVSVMTGLLAAFGRRAVGVGVSAVLALLYGMAAPSGSGVIGHAAIFAAGGTAYALVALLLTALSDNRTRLLYLGEALLSLARYIKAKAALYDAHAKPRPVLQALIEAHADLVERLQAARDMIFSGKPTSKRARWTAALIALLDAFDTMLSSDADIETLQDSVHRHLMRRMHALIIDLGQDVEGLALSLMAPAAPKALPDRNAQLKAIEDEIVRLAPPASEPEPLEISAFRSTCRKLSQTLKRLQRLAFVLDKRVAPLSTKDIDFAPFIRSEDASWNALRAQMKLSSPVLRYALRLTLAMTCGYLLTLAFSDYVHGGWVLLTTALIMRANYSTTRQRRDDRVIGNLAGCVVTVFMIRFFSGDALAATIILAIAISHAFATINYKITAFAACISALLQLHFVSPLAQPLLLERILDTLVGAGLAWGFSYVLPSWEWRKMPRLIRGLLKTDSAYAVQALTREPADQMLRLTRKRMHDAAADLSTTVRRLVDEPHLDRRALVAMNELLAANYLLASDLASMRVLFRARAEELEPEPTEQLLAVSRQSVSACFALGGDPTTQPGSLSRQGFVEVGGTNASMALKRRLVHVERMAQRVTALATRALRETAS